jgi:hypothetical protein
MKKKERIILFLLLCIPIRIIIGIIPLYIKKEWLRYYGYVLLIPAIGFLILYFGNYRLKAPESGGETWWACYRLIHGLLYLCGGIYAIQKKRIAWIPLIIDVIIGLLLHIKNK